MILYLAEIDHHDGVSLATLRVATGAYTTGPADAPANTPYLPRLSVPGNFGRTVTDQQARANGGEIRLANADGALDYLRDHGLDGRRLRLLSIAPGAPYSTAVIRLEGTMDQPLFEWSQSSPAVVVIRMRDRMAELAEKPVQETLFAGTTTGAGATAEGRPEDLKGKVKPLGWGRPAHVTPAYANIFDHIFDLGGGAADDLYSRGYPLTFGADHGTLADLQAASPAAGTYDTCDAEGYAMMGTAPTGIVTAFLTFGASAADRTVVAIMEDLVTGPGGIDPADLDTAALSALDVACPYEAGLWVDTPRSIGDLLDELAASIGAYWTFDRLGKFTVGRIDAPTGAPVATMTAAEILAIRRVAGSLPIWRAVVGYDRNWTVLRPEDVVDANMDFEAWAGVEYRTTDPAEDGAIQTKHLLAAAVVENTLLTQQADADAVAAWRLARDKQDVDWLIVTLPADLGANIDLGDEIRLDIPRFGMAGGKDFVVYAINEEWEYGRIELGVRG